MEPPSECLCPICREVFDAPRLLPCQHVFCTGCLSALWVSHEPKSQTPSLACPLCRAEFRPPDDQISALPVSALHQQWTDSFLKSIGTDSTPFGDSPLASFKSRSIGNFVHGIAQDKTSTESKGVDQTMEKDDPSRAVRSFRRPCKFESCNNEAKLLCLNGCGEICNDCHLWHQRAPSSRWHRVSEIDTKKSNAIPVHSCVKHDGLPFELYCNNCVSDPFMCYKCAYQDKSTNPDHIHIKYEESLDALEQESVALLEQSKLRLEELETQRQRLVEDLTKVEDQSEVVKGMIQKKMKEYRTQLDDFRTRLDEIENDMIEKADQLHGEIWKSLELQLEDIDSTYNCVQFGKTLYEEALKWRSNYSSPYKLPYARRFLGTSLDRNVDSVTPVNKEIVFRPTSSIVLNLTAPPRLHWVQFRTEWRKIQRNLEEIGPMYKKVGGPNYGSGHSQFYYPWGVAVHPKTGYVYVADRSNHRIQVLNPNLEFVDVFGSLGNGTQHFNGPQGIAISEDGMIAVVDYCNHRVQIFNSAFQHLHTLGTGTPGEANGQFSNPYNAVFDHDGNIFVTDLSNSRVQKFDSSGGFVCTFGNIGSGPAETRLAEGICLTDEDEVCILGYGTDTLKFFNTHGEFMRGVKIQLVNRNSLCIGPEGTIFVSDYSRHQILIYSRDGVLIRAFGSNGSGDGELNNPMGIAFGLNNRLYVCEYSNHRIQAF